MKVREVNMTDGVKLVFDSSTWLLFRLSGTEPVARIYAEACSPKDLKRVLDAGKRSSRRPRLWHPERVRVPYDKLFIACTARDATPNARH